MRIAEVVNNLEIGGVERMVVDLAPSLKARGHDVYVICLRRAGPLAAVLEGSGVPVWAVDKSEGRSLKALGRLTRFLRERRIDVVHTHNPLVHHYGAVGGRIARVPVVLTTRHGLGNFPGLDRAEANTERIFRVSCWMTDQIVAVCPAARDFFLKNTAVPGTKMSVIPNGISLKRFLSITPRQPGSEFVFGTVGRLVPVKDHRSLLQSLALVLRQNPCCRLEILGDGPLLQELKRLTWELGVAQAVQFHGASLEVPSFLARLDAFVLSSISEALPLTVLEAMAAGLPIVSTAVGGLPEIVDKARCGWLCPPSQPQSLARLMVEALHSGERAEIGARARAHVMQEHSLAAMTDRYELLFERLLCRNSRRTLNGVRPGDDRQTVDTLRRSLN